MRTSPGPGSGIVTSRTVISPGPFSTAARIFASGGSRNARHGLCRGIAVDHPGTEIGERLRLPGRTGVVRRDTEMLRREAEGHRHVEIGERVHLSIEPVDRAGAEAVGPAKPGTQLA